MNSIDENSANLDAGRVPRVLGSLFILGFVVFGIVVASQEQGVPAQYGITAFFCYAILSSLLISSVAARLYRQHKVREMKFDMASLILISVQIALPFAFANVFWCLLQMEFVEGVGQAKTTVLLVLAGLAVFLLFPIFFLTEACLSWYSLYVKTQRRET